MRLTPSGQPIDYQPFRSSYECEIVRAKTPGMAVCVWFSWDDE